MRRTWQWVLTGAVVAALAGCGGDETPPGESSGGMDVQIPSLPQGTDVESVMVGLVDQAAHELWGLQAAGMAPPESETGWNAVERYAIQLIAAGSYITWGNPEEMDPNWTERTGWKVYSQDLMDAGVKALDAAIRRDADGVLAAGDNLDAACASCHEEYGVALEDDEGN